MTGMALLAIQAAGITGLALAAFPPPGADVWEPVTGSWNAPVLRADNSSWEHSAVQEPQIMAHNFTSGLGEAGGSIKIRMWYRGAGWDRPSGVGVADSTDGGRTWVKHPGNPVYTGGDSNCAGQPWVYKEVGLEKFWLFTTSNGPGPAKTCVATSADGVLWANATGTAASVVPLPPGGKLFGNRAEGGQLCHLILGRKRHLQATI